MYHVLSTLLNKCELEKNDITVHVSVDRKKPVSLQTPERAIGNWEHLGMWKWSSSGKNITIGILVSSVSNNHENMHINSIIYTKQIIF